MDQKFSISELRDRLEENWPEVVTPETEAVLGLMRISEIVNSRANDISSKFDLTPAAFDTLVTLRSMPKPRALTPSELFRSVLITSGGMTKVLDSLEAKGLIAREFQEKDKRSKRVVLTKAGEKIAENCMEAVLDGDRDLLRQALSKKDIARLRDLLLGALEKLE